MSAPSAGPGSDPGQDRPARDPEPAPPWTPERELTPDAALELVREQFPELGVHQIEVLGLGWDNTVYRLDGAWVFRFPRRSISVPLIEREARVLPAIAPALPLAIPVPLFVGAPSAAFPWPFSGARYLAGTTGCRARLDATERERAAVPLAHFLSALHALAPPENVPADELRRLDLSYRIAQIEERLPQAARRDLVASRLPFEAVLADAPTAWTPRTDVLVHGDLYARHVLFDDARAPTAVIDWGDVHCGDPSADLAFIHGFLPPSARAAFRDAYGPIDLDTWRAARVRALYHGLAVLLYAHDVGDEPLLREGRVALGHLADLS